VTPGYLEALGPSLVRGRLLRPEDDERAVPAVVVSAALAERHLGGTDVVGRRLYVGANPAAPPREIVGVVADVRPRWAEDAPEPGIYVPAAQMPIRLPPMTYLVRAARAETDDLHGAVRQQVRAVEPDQAVTRLVAMPELFARGLAVPRLRAWLMLGLAAVGTLLACVGVWAVMAQAVLERGRDLSVRLALGAPGRAVVGEVVRGGLAMSVAGLALGAAGSLAAMRLLGPRGRGGARARRRGAGGRRRAAAGGGVSPRRGSRAAGHAHPALPRARPLGARRGRRLAGPCAGHACGAQAGCPGA
jgi:hypothetical protein